MNRIVITAMLFATISMQQARAQADPEAIEEKNFAAVAKVLKDASDSSAKKVQLAAATASPTTPIPGKDLSDMYQTTIAHCTNSLNRMSRELEKHKRSQAKVSAAGKLVTLLGAVTVYPPGKVVLTGIGISSNDGNSVLGVFAQYSAGEVLALQTRIDDLRKQFSSQITRYESTTTGGDPSGRTRGDILLHAKAVCDGIAIDTSEK